MIEEKEKESPNPETALEDLGKAINNLSDNVNNLSNQVKKLNSNLSTFAPKKKVMRCEWICKLLDKLICPTTIICSTLVLLLCCKCSSINSFIERSQNQHNITSMEEVTTLTAPYSTDSKAF